MNERKYFEQFAGDLGTVTGYFVYSDGSPDYGSLEREACEEAFILLSARHPSIQFEIRVQEINLDKHGEWVRDE